jgi:hypothetical protein
MVSRIAQGHTTFQLMGLASGVRHACGPLAVFEERIVTHDIDQFVIVNHGLVVVRARKNGPTVYNSARRRAMDIDNNSREAFFAFVLSTRHERREFPRQVYSVHASHKVR